MALSALRAGARVQATLWSGAQQFETSGGFIRDEHRILEILTGYIGGSTAFPIHVLRETFDRIQQSGLFGGRHGIERIQAMLPEQERRVSQYTLAGRSQP